MQFLAATNILSFLILGISLLFGFGFLSCIFPLKMTLSHVPTTVSRVVKPILSQNSAEAKKNVLIMYKKLQRSVKRYWWDFEFWDIPIPVFREVLKNQFTKNAHITDVRIIDRKVEECRQHMVAMKYYYYNDYHVRNMLFAENIEPKPKDFLSKFLRGKE